ncbi:hypothetical protein C0J52_01534 [Blattella germanica]|nr:hypothetical protein C0J52_01534 [Blattella germanica]
MGGSSLTILHYNDVYNIDSRVAEPVGGAARFCTAVKSFSHLNPLVLFSGDIFSPSMLSSFTKGEQMVPVLNECGTHCAVFGNHDFDFGLEVLSDWVSQTNFPWLMSNVIDQETGRPLGDGRITHVVDWNGKRIGLGCDYVIALTHMRNPNDIKLAENCDEIDLILGGHDHVYEVNQINGKYVIKSGTDFRHFSKITLNFDKAAVDVSVEEIAVTSSYSEDPTLKQMLEKYSSVMEGKMDEVLGSFSVPLDGRFESVRTGETNLGNWVCDVILAATGADLVILNSGTLRSDTVHPAGNFTMRDLVTIIPMMDPLVVISVTGQDILEALENGVCQYPKLEGRFPQVAGISFAFDPRQPPGKRVDPQLVRIGDEYLVPDQKYRLATKTYLYSGCDGYSMLKDAKCLVDEEECPELGRAVQNHFQAIDIRLGKTKRHSKHRQSLVTLSRRHSLVKMLDVGELDGPPPLRRASTVDHQAGGDDRHSPSPCPPHAHPHPYGHPHPHPHPPPHTHAQPRSRLTRRASLDDLEQESCQLTPRIEGRIVILTDEKRRELLLERQRLEEDSVIPEVEDECSPQGSIDKVEIS